MTTHNRQKSNAKQFYFFNSRLTFVLTRLFFRNWTSWKTLQPRLFSCCTFSLQDYMKNVRLRGHQLSEEKINNLLLDIRRTFENRQDILPAIHRSFTQLTLELLLSLCKWRSLVRMSVLVSVENHSWIKPPKHIWLGICGESW